MLVHRTTTEGIKGAGTLPPLFVITDTDHGGYVCVVLYSILILMLLLVATRIYTRYYVLKLFRIDDYFLILAALLGTLQSVFVQLAVNHGLGQDKAIVSDADFEKFLQYEYASQILLIATVAFAKLSLSLLIQSLMSEGFSLLACRSLIGVIIAWAVTSIFAMAFGCSLPHPWDINGQNCIDMIALNNVIAALNIATDTLLILLPCLVFWKVHDKLRRYRVVALFASRIIVCVFTGIQIRYFNRYVTSDNPTWVHMDATIWDQLMMNFSIMCTAIPSLGRLIVELQPEVNAFAITEQHGLRSADKYALSSFGHRFPNAYVINNRLGAHVSARRSRSKNRDSDSIRGLAQDSMAQNNNVIKHTVDFEVKYMEEGEPC